MPQAQTFELITPDCLLARVRALRERGCRLVQISANRLADQLELIYSFDLDSELSHLRLSLPAADAQVPSISSIYGCVLLYENEIHDLFNVRVDGMAVDFKGNLYKTAVKFPFASVKPPAPAKPAAAPPRPQELEVSPGPTPAQ